MSVSIRSDAGGALGVLQLNGSDIVRFDVNGVGGAISGLRRNLLVGYTGTSGVVTVTADALSLWGSGSGYITILNINLSATSGNASGTANSLDSGSWAYSTWYNLFVIYNPTTATSALLWSLSATTPTLPSGYTYFARIGANRTQSATNFYFMGGTQADRKFQYKVASSGNMIALPLIISGVQGNIYTPTWVPSSIASFVPATASRISLVLSEQSIGSTTTAMAAPNNAYGAFESTTNPAPIVFIGTTGQGRANMAYDMLIEGGSIYFASDNASSSLFCLGWEDNL